MKKIIIMPLILSIYYIVLLIGLLLGSETLLVLIRSTPLKVVFVITFIFSFYALSQLFRKAEFKVNPMIYIIIFGTLISNLIPFIFLNSSLALTSVTLLNLIVLLSQIILSLFIILSKNKIIKHYIELKLFAISFLVVIFVYFLSTLTNMQFKFREFLTTLYAIPYLLLFLTFHKNYHQRLKI